MILSLHKQPFVTAHFQFITAHFVRHCALKNALQPGPYHMSLRLAQEQAWKKPRVLKNFLRF